MATLKLLNELPYEMEIYRLDTVQSVHTDQEWALTYCTPTGDRIHEGVRKRFPQQTRELLL